MAIAVHIDDLNRGVEIAHHRGGVRVLSEVAVACSDRHREQTVGSKLHDIEAPVLVHVAQPRDHRSIVIGYEVGEWKIFARVAEIWYEAAACNRHDEIHITIIVQIARSHPASCDRTFRIEKLSL